MAPRLLPALCALLAAMFVLCSDDSTGTGPSDSAVRFTADEGTYTLQNDSILTTYMSTVQCAGSRLDTVFDTSGALVRINNQTLTMISRDTMSTAVVEWTRIFSRIGSGSGLVGEWGLQSYTFAVIAGTMTSAELAEHEQDTGYYNAALRHGAYVEKFEAGGSMTVYYEGNYAAVVMDAWLEDAMKEMNDSSYVRVDADVIDARTIRYTGGITHEVVTTTYSDNLDATHTSTKPSHQPAILEPKEPRSCPEPDSTWMDDFFSENVALPYYVIDVLDQLGLFTNYDILATAVNDTNMTVYGRKSGETVTLTFLGDSAVVWSSTVPAHATDTTASIGNEQPDWFTLFLLANPKALGKGMVLPEIPAIRMPRMAAPDPTRG